MARQQLLGSILAVVQHAQLGQGSTRVVEQQTAGSGWETATAQREPRANNARRRHIDPTTCERDYSGDELEFMRALDDYKRKNGRMFPTCSEILEVIRGLGYHKEHATHDLPVG